MCGLPVKGVMRQQIRDEFSHIPSLADKEIHVVADNLSATRRSVFELFLKEHPGGEDALHPNYSSWLNQVECWFSKIERDVTARGVFTSVKDLAKKLMRYIRNYN